MSNYPTTSVAGGPVGHRILLPVASPELSTRALPVARKLALDLGSEVTVLTVREEPRGPLILDRGWSGAAVFAGSMFPTRLEDFRPRYVIPVDELVARILRHTERSLQGVLWQLRCWKVQARAQVRLGSVPDEIARAALEARADLIVMAERRLGRWQRLWREDPSQAVRRISPVPVLSMPL